MSRNTKIIAIVGGLLIVVAGGFFIAGSRAPAPAAQERGYTAH